MTLKRILCKVFGHQEVTAAVHNKNSMRATTVVQTRCKRCGETLESNVFSKKQSRHRSK